MGNCAVLGKYGKEGVPEKIGQSKASVSAFEAEGMGRVLIPK